MVSLWGWTDADAAVLPTPPSLSDCSDGEEDQQPETNLLEDKRGQ